MTHLTMTPESALFPERLAGLVTQLHVRADEATYREATLGRYGLPALKQPMVAIVGARSCTDYGAHVARSLARELGAAGVCVVSGLARGIDAWAHRGAIEGGGRTIAVLGCGIDRDYPRAHSQLASQITETGGLILSEYEPGVPPAPWRFPARNRIVAALADAVIVVEARPASGALITVGFATEYLRPIYAVPGEITSALSAGPNALIASGAAVCLTEAKQLYSALGLPRFGDCAECGTAGVDLNCTGADGRSVCDNCREA